jgi:uncharacterized protein (UPF0333 family)
MTNPDKIIHKQVNRKEFLQYALVTLVAVAAISPVSYFLGSNKKPADSAAYGNTPYGGAKR